jgi:hypothetical protein
MCLLHIPRPCIGWGSLLSAIPPFVRHQCWLGREVSDTGVVFCVCVCSVWWVWYRGGGVRGGGCEDERSFFTFWIVGGKQTVERERNFLRSGKDICQRRVCHWSLGETGEMTVLQVHHHSWAHRKACDCSVELEVCSGLCFPVVWWNCSHCQDDIPKPVCNRLAWFSFQRHQLLV